jgi:hypothetical protein
MRGLRTIRGQQPKSKACPMMLIFGVFGESGAMDNSPQQRDSLGRSGFGGLVIGLLHLHQLNQSKNYLTTTQYIIF